MTELEASDKELTDAIASIHSLMEQGPEEEINLNSKMFISTVLSFLNIPKSSFTKLALTNDKAIPFLTNQLIKQIKSRAFNVIEEIFYFTPKLKHSVTVENLEENSVLIYQYHIGGKRKIMEGNGDRFNL